MKKIIGSIENFEKELLQNKQIKVTRFNYFESPANSGQLDELEKKGKIEKAVLNFYRESDGFEIDWLPIDPELTKNEIIGRVKINPFQQVVRNWQGVVFFEGEPDNSPRKKFFPMDFFADEAAAGFCTLEGYRTMMFLFRFEGDLIPLNVTLDGYLELLLNAKGCFYWQYLIIEIITGKENLTTEQIKKFLPAAFPDFSFNSFREIFERVRIR